MTEDQASLHLYTSQAGAGSRQALDALIRRYMNMVYSSALRQLRDPHLAEDVTQAVFLILAQKAKKIRPGVPVGGWLLAVTRRTAVDVMRRRTLDRRHELAIAKPELTLAAAAEWEQIAPFIDAAMDQLPHRDRDAVVLRILENQSLAQVGTQLGLTESAAAKRVTRALSRLKNLLKGHGISTGAAALSATLASHSVHAAPAHLLTSALSGAASASATVLAKSTLSAMSLASAKISAALILLCLLLTVLSIAVVSKPTPVPNARPLSVAHTPLPENWRISGDFTPDGPGEALGIASDGVGNTFAAGILRNSGSVAHGIVREKSTDDPNWRIIYDLPGSQLDVAMCDSAGNLFITGDKFISPQIDTVVHNNPPNYTPLLLKRSAGNGAFIEINSTNMPMGFCRLAADNAGNVYVYHPTDPAVAKLAPGELALSIFHPMRDAVAGAPDPTFYAIAAVGDGPHPGLYAIGSDKSHPLLPYIIRRSTDAGLSWATVGTTINSPEDGANVSTSVAMISGHGGALYLTQTVMQADATQLSHYLIRKSIDGGATWTLENDFPMIGRPSMIDMVRDEVGNIYIAGRTTTSSGSLSFIRTNKGGPWFTVREAPQTTIWWVAVDSAGILYANEIWGGKWRISSLDAPSQMQPPPSKGIAP